MTSLWGKYFSRNNRKKNRSEAGYHYSRNDYDASYIIAEKVLKFIGICITKKRTPIARRYWDLYYWFEFANVFLGVSLEFLSMVETATGGSFEDAVTIFTMLPCFGYSILALAKSYKMVYYRSTFENLVSELRDMWPQRAVFKEEHHIIKRALNELNFIVRGYYWCNNALLVSFLMPAFYKTLKRYAGYDSQMVLQFFYWLPFDPFQAVYFELVLLLQTWHALIVVWSNICGDLLFCIFLSHITTQFDLLSLRIRTLIYVPVDSQLIKVYPLGVYSKEYFYNEGNILETNDVKIWEERHVRALTKIIIRHRALIRLAGDVENMFSFALLVNFINSSIIICFCGFCCVFLEKWNEIAYKSFLLTALSQTWLLCWYGQKLVDSSVRVAEALYNSGWYTSSKKIKSSLLIMLHRTQKAVHVTTYGFSVISLGSYTTIIKTAWSYFTLLLKTYKQ